VSPGDAETFGGIFGLSLVPPVADGYLSVRGEWSTRRLWRFGAAVDVPLARFVRVGLAADAVRRRRRWGAGLGGRFEVQVAPALGVFAPTAVTEFRADNVDFSNPSPTLYASIGIRFWVAPAAIPNALGAR